MTFPDITSMLTWWQWMILAIIPPAIVLLYFLKLKRRPIEVPSTYLWLSSIEDLHVNTIWQRLRRNLLLFLQLLILLLVALALLRPSWFGKELSGERFIFLVDNSASMQATDVDDSRLEEAKRKALELIESMKSGDVAMVVSFSDAATIEQAFTDSRGRLRAAVEGIKPSQRSTSLKEALKAASGLANPGRSSFDMKDDQVAEAKPAELYVISDGRFPPVEGFSLGNLNPTFVPVGSKDAKNVGITMLSVRRSEVDTTLLQVFAQLENAGDEDATVVADLLHDNQLVDAAEVKVPAGERQPTPTFELRDADEGVLKLRLRTTDDRPLKDDLALDNEAWVVLNPPRPMNILLVTEGYDRLEWILDTDSASESSLLQVESPEFLKDKKYEALADGGAFDLIVYDRCRPEKMPQANTMFIGAIPPGDNWSAEPEVFQPTIVDVANSHPLMQWLDLSDVEIYAATPLKGPSNATMLIDSDSDAGPIVSIAPRDGFQDLVLGFSLEFEVYEDEDGKEHVRGTNWTANRASFPVFMQNMLDYFSGRHLLQQRGCQPGDTIDIKGANPKAKFQVKSPSGEKFTASADNTGVGQFSDTHQLGVYSVESQERTLQPFAVNMFDPAETRIRTNEEPTIQIGYVEVKGKADWTATRRDIWQLLVAAGLVVLLLEWYIYNRRVYM